MANELSKEQLQRLARLGANARLEELEAERRAILRAFPGLAGQAKAGESEAPGAAAAQPKKGRRRKKMSAAQRKAASERMRTIWAERRKTTEA